MPSRLTARSQLEIAQHFPSGISPDWVMLLLAVSFPLQQQEIGIAFFHLSPLKAILWSCLLVWAILILRTLYLKRGNSYRQFAPPLFLPLIFLGLLFIPSVFNSVSAAAWAKDLGRYGLAVSGYAFLYYWIRTRGRERGGTTVRRFLLLMSAAGAISSLVLVWQYLTFGDACAGAIAVEDLHRNQTAFFIDANYCAEFLVTLLPLTMALALAEARPRFASAIWMLAVLLVLGIWLTLSRSVLVVMGVAVLALALYLGWTHFLDRSKLKPALMGIALTLSIVLALAIAEKSVRCQVPTLIAFSSARFESAATDSSPAGDVSRRLAIWQSGLEMIRGNVWFGAGLGNFELQFPFYKVGNTGGDHRAAHNTFIRLWAETGIFGFVMYLLLLFLVGRYVVQTIRRSGKSAWTLVLLGLFFGWLASLGESFFLDQFLEAYYWIYLGLLVGVATLVHGQRPAADAWMPTT